MYGKLGEIYEIYGKLGEIYDSYGISPADRSFRPRSIRPPMPHVIDKILSTPVRSIESG
jgi:hypothetical protein